MFGKLFNATKAALGDSKAEGALQRQQTKEKLWGEWNKSCGIFNWDGTYGNVVNFLARYNIDFPDTNMDDNQKLTKQDIDRLFDRAAMNLIASGAVKFGK